MNIIREMINSNNKEKESRYVIIAIANNTRETVHSPMIIGRDEARKSCIDQLANIEGL